MDLQEKRKWLCVEAPKGANRSVHVKCSIIESWPKGELPLKSLHCQHLRHDLPCRWDCTSIVQTFTVNWCELCGVGKKDPHATFSRKLFVSVAFSLFCSCGIPAAIPNYLHPRNCGRFSLRSKLYNEIRLACEVLKFGVPGEKWY